MPHTSYLRTLKLAATGLGKSRWLPAARLAEHRDPQDLIAEHCRRVPGGVLMLPLADARAPAGDRPAGAGCRAPEHTGQQNPMMGILASPDSATRRGLLHGALRGLVTSAFTPTGHPESGADEPAVIAALQDECTVGEGVGQCCR